MSYVTGCLSPAPAPAPAPACTHCCLSKTSWGGHLQEHQAQSEQPLHPCHPAATEDGAGAKEAKPSEAAGECFAMLRLAQLRTPLAALSWSKKGSIAPRPHGQKSLMVKPQRAAASQPSSLAATPLPAGAWSQCQSRREQGMFPMVIPINKPTAIHVQRLHSFH